MLSRFDWLTPPITLYYNEGLQHSSIGSVIMSILGYVSSVIIGLYLSIDFFKRKNPTVFYFNRYVEDSGIYSFNSESIFHNFQFVDTTDAIPRQIDFSYIRVIGTELSIQTYLERNNTPRDDHWIYGLCDNDTDIKGIEYLYDYDIFNQSYCIKKYYKADEKKYYSTNDEKFRWPHADHGTSHPNKTFYGLVFQNCIEDSVKVEMIGNQPCKSVTEIAKYVNKYYVRFYMIDHYPDVYNYKTPFTKYFYNIDSTLTDGSYQYNHINFNPAKINTNNGLFFDNTIEEQEYMFDQNTQESGTYHGAYVAFYFWLKNQMAIYDRTYKRIQDVLAEVEAMIDLIIFLATIINNFISEYITLRDTVHVLFTLKSKKVNKSQINRILQNKRRTMFIKASPPKRNNEAYNNNYYYNSNKNEENSDRLGMNSNNTRQRLQNSRTTRREQISYQRVNEKNNSSRFNKNSENSNMRGNILKNKNNDVDIYNKVKIDSPKEEEKVSKADNVDEIMPGFDSFKETKLSLSEFAYNYFFFCKKKENSIDTYENFRMKIISEENLIQNYLDIYSLNKSFQLINKDEGGGGQ